MSAAASPGSCKARRCAIRLGLAAALLICLGLTARAAGAAIPGRFVIVSDLHFDPMADPALVDRLAAAAPAEWPAILDASKKTSLGRYGADTNWRLLRSVLRQMPKALPHPAFVLIPGDFLAHNFRAKFETTTHDTSEEGYRRFVGKTMRFIADQLEAAFPDTPILPTLGNNDAVCGDYEIEPDGPFLADAEPVMRTLLGSAGSALGRDWLRYGNYETALPDARDLRAVFVNTVFFSIRYRDACGGAGGAHPGQATLAWLAGRLAAARAAHRRVWLVYHVPPGIDGFATWRQGDACSGAIVPMWDESYARSFSALLRRYAGTVIASFAGHTHMDDFRLLGDAKGAFADVLITPALSPIYDQNPAFRTVDYDGKGDLIDQTTYELANLGEAGTGHPPLWRAEYTFTRAWRLPQLDLVSLGELYRRIVRVPADRDLWHRLFVVSSPVYWRLDSTGSGDEQEFRDLTCATGHAEAAGYRRCACGGAP